ncbi:hypothetical protein L0128_10590 [candidate division KSB1 bacterium]|nr:hypothetical protein [candidate division KSB1 bacterium]
MKIKTILVTRGWVGVLLLVLSVSLLQAQSRPRRGANRLQTINRLLNQGQVDAAKKEILVLLKRDPENLVVHEYLALVHLKREDYAGARKEVEWILAKKPNSSCALMVLGRILIKEKKPLAAQNAFLRAYKTSDSTEEQSQLLQDLKAARVSSAQVVRDEGLTHRRSPRLTPSTPTDSQQIAPEHVPGQHCPRIAVFPFEDANVASEQLKVSETLSEMLMTALTQTEKFEVIERLQLNKILEEQALNQTGVIEEETAVAVGQILGLDAVVVGSISRLRSQLEADARLVEMSSGKIVTAANASAPNADQIRTLAQNLARSLAQKAQAVKLEAPVSGENE